MRYSTDLTDPKWQLIHYCFPKRSKTRRPRQHSYRELVNALFYLNRTGCQWRNLPKDFAPWRTVYHYFCLWKRNGLWAAIHHHWCEHVRLLAGRQCHASAGIIDSQSIKSTECSNARGDDAGKKVTGRKRHLLVDTMGLILGVLVLPANVQDREGDKQLLNAFFGQACRRHLKHLWADGGYTGTLVAWARSLWQCTIEIVKRSESPIFRVLPRRWIVERTFGWLGRYRRLNRDYERHAETGEIMVYVAMIQLMLTRLVRD